MKSYVILFVAVLMLIKPLWPVAEYIVNYDYIVNVLCENKDKPEMQCDGKCYLAQMLAEESKQHENNPFGEKQTKTEIQCTVFFQPLSSIDLRLPLIPKKRNITSNPQDLIITLFTSDVARPPELS